MGRSSTVTVRPVYSSDWGNADPEARLQRDDIDAAGSYLFQAGALSASRSFVGAVRIGGNRLVIAGFNAQSVNDAAIASLEDSAPVAGNSGLSAITPTLVALFNEKPGIRAAIYTQSPNLTAFAVAGQPLPNLYGSGLLKRTPVAIPVVEWLPLQSPHALLETLRQHTLASAVLLANRGFLVWSDEPIVKLARFAVSLEESASITINARALGGAKPLPSNAFEAMQSSISGD